MFNTCTRSIAGVSRWIAGFTSVLTLCSVNTHAESLSTSDINHWLDKSSQTNFATRQIDESTLYDQPMNPAGFTTNKTSINRIKEKLLLRQFSDKLKVQLFEKNSYQKRHFAYLNILKRELVSNNRWGKVDYQLKLSEKQTELRFNYNF